MKNRAGIQGYEIDLTTCDHALDLAAEAVNNGENFQVVTINPEMIELAHKNPDFSRILHHAELVLPDGVGVQYALRLKGIKQERVRGIDFTRALIDLCDKKSYRLALLGAKPDVLQAVVTKLKDDFKNLNIVYARDGYFTNEHVVIEELKAVSPQVLLCALGAPKQEMLIAKLKNELLGCAMVGVGGSFDVIAGTVKEAPEIWRKLSLEWLYRTLSQPERFGRIFPTLPIFLFRSIMDSIKNSASSHDAFREKRK